MSRITPLLAAPRLSECLGVDLKVKRDDLYPFAGGGSKSRKFVPFLKDALRRGADALVTSGSAQSNHARVVALAAAEMGWKCVVVIHDTNASHCNLELMRLAGADLRFVAKTDVAYAMDCAMDELSKQGHHPYYIWGGGQGVLGTAAFYSAARELISQAGAWSPDFVVVASGTGGTQAGLHVGFKEAVRRCVVIGVSVARKEPRGSKATKAVADEVCTHLGVNASLSEDIVFRDDWIGNGYGTSSKKVYDVVSCAVRQEALITDLIYSGKALTALFDMCDSEEIPSGARVVFWHTGSLVTAVDSFYGFDH